ncbi:hypothetical protein [Telmatospirillum siberiense]|uniref:hypothetical protein n=1 Tax=Telmatospirillum siberiense TaxID=382514 RepID=UPI001304342B|nr:hypothetical protein [Telmatospirillum siberiense]
MGDHRIDLATTWAGMVSVSGSSMNDGLGSGFADAPADTPKSVTLRRAWKAD